LLALLCILMLLGNFNLIFAQPVVLKYVHSNCDWLHFICSTLTNQLPKKQTNNNRKKYGSQNIRLLSQKIKTDATMYLQYKLQPYNLFSASEFKTKHSLFLCFKILNYKTLSRLIQNLNKFSHSYRIQNSKFLPKISFYQ